MNNVQLIGRLVGDPNVKWTQDGKCIARYTLAVDRPGKDKGADFISCVAFEKTAEFAEKYLVKGMKIAITGRINTGSYTSRDGHKIYTTDVNVQQQEFCERKQTTPASTGPDDFDQVQGADDDLPFK